MMSVLDKLVLPKDRLSLLFTPPFDKTPRDPGYIKGYLPGIRENGGQYTHAATWNGWAFTRMGEGKQAAALFDLLNPLYHCDTAEKANVYRVEPYVVCADIYSVPPYVRCGGWTWYTGSAAWFYRLGLEAILGLQRLNGDTLRIDPVIPPDWEGYTIDYRYGSSVYHIQVNNPDKVASGVQSMQVDGSSQENAIRLVDDGQEHHVTVTMGAVAEKG
jgi:cyclic beta-1,2-glucan synthetase